MPFPGIIFMTPSRSGTPTPSLHELSKLGLPGTRCGIVIADEKIIRAITNLSGIINLAPGSLGPAITIPMIESGDIITLSEQVVKPFYQHKATFAVQLLREAIPGSALPHPQAGGALFLWLWFEDLPIHCQELYERLKAKNLLIVPGHFSPASTTPSGATARSASASTMPRAKIWCVVASPSWPTRSTPSRRLIPLRHDQKRGLQMQASFLSGGQRCCLTGQCQLIGFADGMARGLSVFRQLRASSMVSRPCSSLAPCTSTCWLSLKASSKSRSAIP